MTMACLMWILVEDHSPETDIITRRDGTSDNDIPWISSALQELNYILDDGKMGMCSRWWCNRYAKWKSFRKLFGHECWELHQHSGSLLRHNAGKKMNRNIYAKATYESRRVWISLVNLQVRGMIIPSWSEWRTAESIDGQESFIPSSHQNLEFANEKAGKLVMHTSYYPWANRKPTRILTFKRITQITEIQARAIE